ncbi:MAG: GNAT family N-acetyltransferase [Solirubrobacteraceae bacterium]|jgi:GNAT superfamily N-acetyltransferase|nr:GNAT family N-acetyltransferase [Solirubrobacteraceae bacterium]
MAARIRPASAADAPALDPVLAAAFAADPITEHILPDPRRRDAALRRGMGHVLREVYVPAGGALTTEELDGVALWARPGDPKPSALQELRGLPTFIATFRRHLPRAMRAFGEAEKRRPDEPHWFLDVLAVRPDRQGRGIGGALVRAGLADADAAGAPAFLVTSNPANVPLYEHLGFAVQEPFAIGPVRAWPMLRAPAGETARAIGAGG